MLISFVINSLYGIATFVIYTMIIVMINRQWIDYHGSYFKIYIIDFFVNLVTFLNSFITLRIPQATCKECLVASIFDRFTSTMENRSIILNIFHTIHAHMAYVQYAIILLSTDRSRIYAHLLVYILIVTLLTTVCNLISFARLTVFSIKISTGERNLVLTSFVTFLVQLLAGANTLALAFLVDESNANTFWGQIPQTLSPYVSDALTLCQPWALLIFSKKIRDSFIKTYFGFTKTPVMTIQVTSREPNSHPAVLSSLD
ncbi:unnamed protein product [Caenorhabditis bovis]|uniref:Serpentine receptor class gamma n=1 Tax=Caenorhabditis bovis TaxID=2654633 RepID=A0A8S1E8M7_9PELO|nr:unnamed protein product [Caenorhabditis bovis]